MKNIIFAHDHVFVRCDADCRVYSPGKLPYSAFARYLALYEKVTVLARSKQVETKLDIGMHGVVEASGDRLKFVFINNLSSLKSLIFGRRQVENVIANAIKDADAVVVRLPSEIGLRVVSACRKLERNYWVELVACPWDAMIGYGTIAGKLYAPILTCRTMLAVGGAERVMYVTEGFLQSRYPSKGRSYAASNVQIENVCSLDDVSIVERLARRRDGVTPLKIGMIGDLSSPHKGFECAFNALNALNESGLDVVLEIVGALGRYSAIEYLDNFKCKGKISFRGVMPPGAHVLRWLESLDVYIQPSVQEGLPRSAIEAMSRGVPIVTSNVGGLPELNETCWMHNPGDHAKLAVLLKSLVEDQTAVFSQIERNLRISRKYLSCHLQEVRNNFLSLD